MKITNNKIVVELPILKPVTLINPMTNRKVKAPPFAIGYNIAIKKAKELNSLLVVDIEALAKLISSVSFKYKILEREQRYQQHILLIKPEDFMAKHLAENLDKWLIEKKENKTL